MKVADTVGAVLASTGVRHVFGLVGSGNFVVTNSLVAAGAAFIASRHEGGAVAMAAAYARSPNVVRAAHRAQTERIRARAVSRRVA